MVRRWLSAGFAAVLMFSTFSAIATQLITIDAHANYPEGPLWYRHKLYYVEYGLNDVNRWDGKRTAVWWHRAHCGPSSIIPFRGHLLIACYDSNTLVEVDSAAHDVRTVRRYSNGKPFAGPDDFAADGRGGIYFTPAGAYDIKAPITGTVGYLTPDGKEIEEVANTIDFSNGLTVEADHKHLLVAEMLAARILSFPIGANGELGARSVWARLQDLAAPTPHEDAYNGPDGFKLGPDGNYYIAQNGSARVLVVSGARKLVRIIRVPTPYCSNIAFGPAGSVFITGAFEQWKQPYLGAVYWWKP